MNDEHILYIYIYWKRNRLDMTYISLLLNEKHSHAHTHEVWIVSTARREEYMFIIRNCSHLFKQNAQLYISHIFFFQSNAQFTVFIGNSCSDFSIISFYYFFHILRGSELFKTVHHCSQVIDAPSSFKHLLLLPFQVPVQ